MAIGEKINLLRKQHNLTQDDLGKVMNVSRQAIQKWETNVSVPDIYKLKALADFFHVSVDYFLQEENVIETLQQDSSTISYTPVISDSSKKPEEVVENSKIQIYQQSVEGSWNKYYLKKVANNNEKKKERKRKLLKFLRYFIPSFTGTTVITLLIIFLFIPLFKYNNALDLMNNGDYNGAEDILSEIPDFGDSDSQIKMVEAYEHLTNGSFEEAIKIICNLGGSVNVTYDGNSGVVSKTNEVISDKNDPSIKVISTKRGYTFIGWEIKKFTISSKPNKYIADITLEATYELSNYTIEFDLSGGKWKTYKPISEYNLFTDVIILNPQKDGYTFVGWKDLDTGDVISILRIFDSVGDKRYIAIWEPKEYKLSFNTKGGREVSDKHITFGNSCKMPTTKREHYIFSGWYIDGKKVDSSFVWEYTVDKVAVASWIPVEYKITYSNIENIVNYDELKFKYTIKDTISIPNPIRHGYNFIGWTKGSDDSPCKDLKINSGSYGDIKLTANWTDTFTFSLNLNGGSVEEDYTNVAYYETKYTLPTPFKDGYVFVGWEYNGRHYFDTCVWDFDYDVTFNAFWSKYTPE